MKLHLPKMLLAAVVAAVACFQQAAALTITDNAVATGHTLTLTENAESITVGGSAISYNWATGVLSGWNSNNVFTLNGIDTTDEDWTAGTALVYNSANTNDGSMANNSFGLIIAENGALEGLWGDNGGRWNSGDNKTSTGTITSSLNVTLNSSSGVTLKDSADTQLLNLGGLKSSGASYTNIYINKNLVESVTLYEYASPTEYYFTNADGSWRKAVSALNDVYNVTNGETKFTTSTQLDSNKDIIVGGTSSGLLFLATGENNNQGDITVENDIYLANTNNLYNSIHFGNDWSSATTTMNGNIYLIESATISSRGAYDIYINGKVTDKNVPGSSKADGGYDLTIRGNGYIFNDEVDVKSVDVIKYNDSRKGQVTFNADVNTKSVTIGAGAEVTLGGDMTTDSFSLGAGGTLTLAGGTLTVTNSITLSTVTVDLSQYFDASKLVDKTYSVDLVTAAGGITDWAAAQTGTYTADGTKYTTTVDLSGNSIVLTFATIDNLVVNSALLTGNVLTLNLNGDLTAGCYVDLTLSADALANIAGLAGPVDLSLVGINGETFTSVQGLENSVNVSFYNGAYTGEVGGQFMIQYIPEPTTATLSLLALAGLAARRRRK